MNKGFKVMINDIEQKNWKQAIKNHIKHFWQNRMFQKSIVWQDKCKKESQNDQPNAGEAREFWKHLWNQAVDYKIDN